MDDLEIVAAAFQNERVGDHWDVVAAPAFDDWTRPSIKLGLLDSSRKVAERTGTQVAQYFYMVRPGLIGAELLYRGVRRDMKVGVDMNADEKVLAYVWRPDADFEWVGGRQSRAFPVKHPPPFGRVFVVLVRPYEKPDKDGISGAILRWNWVYGNLISGPIDDADGPRYTEPVWRRS